MPSNISALIKNLWLGFGLIWPVLAVAQSAAAISAQGAGLLPTTSRTSPFEDSGLMPADPSSNNARLRTATGSEADKALSPERPANDKKGRPAGELRQTVARTEFQDFVFGSTGRALDLFGYDLFSSPEQYAPVLSAPVPASYVLGPGDEIMVQTFGVADMATRLVIDRDGKVTLPKVGPMTLAGVPFSEAEKVLTSHIAKVYSNFTLSLSLGRIRTIEVFVVGQARRPGKHLVSGLSTMINAMFETGGPNAHGSMRRVQLRRGGQTIADIDLYQFLVKGDTLADVRLQSGDIIVIPPAGDRMALLGSVNSSAVYELKAGESVGDILAMSGGLPFLANPHKAQLERLSAQRNVARYVESFALDAVNLKRSLQGGDVLTVFQISPEFSEVVTLQGHVAAPMRYTFRQGMKVADLLPNLKSLITPDYWMQVNSGGNPNAKPIVNFDSGGNPNAKPIVNFDYATVRRLDSKTLSTRLINFNLGKALAFDPKHNLELQAGDIVTIYNTSEVAVPVSKRPHFVTIDGEVNTPGLYEIKPGESLAQLLHRAGGLTDNAYVYGSVFTRESTRKQQQDNLELAIRRAEADLSGQVAAMSQNQTKDRDSGVVIQQFATLQKQQLDRLRGLRASGRIALEIEADAQALPNLNLENGDRINIPVKSDFVSVVGAVLAETAFSHRPNEPVSFYLKKAGVTRDADLDSLMVIRANGSVESDTVASTSWLLGSGVQFKNLNAGDTIFVPERVDRRTGYYKFIEGAKDWTAIFYQFGLGAAAIKTLK